MSLSCSCPEYNEDPGSWCYYTPSGFTVFDRKRRKRCTSCNSLIDIGADCLQFQRTRSAYTEIEEMIMGVEIDMAPLFMCQSCGEIYLNLDDIGYCLNPTESMADYMSEYHEITGFKKEKTNG